MSEVPERFIRRYPSVQIGLNNILAKFCQSCVCKTLNLYSFYFALRLMHFICLIITKSSRH